MEPYVDALRAMHELLDALGAGHWKSWIAKDLQEWENHKSVRHHLSAYGGMGSFNDLWFEDVWLETLFEDLKSTCYYFAHQPTEEPDIEELERSMGNMGFDLSGWRCLKCGYGAVSERDRDLFIARRVVRRRVLEAAGRSSLQQLVREMIEARPSELLLTETEVEIWIGRSGLQIRKSTGWLRPCPSCGSEDTAVYRWCLVRDRDQDRDLRFVPSMENLPLQGKA